MKYFVVDAFTQKPGCGNPAAVVLLERETHTEKLQKIAAEFNLSETAFLFRQSDRQSESHWGLRWFTPAVEVDLCGHATLASALALWEGEGNSSDELSFHTHSGILTVTRQNQWLGLNFPTTATLPTAAEHKQRWDRALNILSLSAATAGKNQLLELENETAVREFQAPINKIAELSSTIGGLIITARADDPAINFVSRFFAPNAGINEDPVTGSIHCALAHYWSNKLGKNTFVARQLSARGGELKVELMNERVLIQGRGILVMQGQLMENILDVL